MIRQSMLQKGEGIIGLGEAFDEDWSDIVRSLQSEALTEEEIAALLRGREAWTGEARKMKAGGFPYHEILFFLRTLCASWSDIGRALMAVGVAPADMLRVLLEHLEEDEPWPVVQAALLEGPEDADYDEVQGVLGFFYMTKEDLLETLDLQGEQRDLAADRLGLVR